VPVVVAVLVVFVVTVIAVGVVIASRLDQEIDSEGA